MTAEIDREMGTVLLRKFGNLLRQPFEYEYDKTITTSPYHPVTIDVVPYESISVIDLIESDNKAINKVLAVFSSLTLEVKHLEKEAALRHFKFIQSYQDTDKESEHIPQELISIHIESLHGLLTFVSRCQDVLLNICTQIFALYGSGVMNMGGIHLHFVLASLSDLLVVMITLEVLINDSMLFDHWKKYRKAIKALQQLPARNDFNIELIPMLDSVFDKMENCVLSDKIVQNALDNLLNLRKNLAEKNCAAVCEEFLHYIKKLLSELERLSIDEYESNTSIKWVQCTSMFTLHSHLFGNMDKKMFKMLVDLNVKIPSVPLCGTALWYPEQFLQRHLPVLCQTYRKLPEIMAKARHAYLLNKKQSIAQDVYLTQVSCNRWALAMEDVCQDSNSQLNSAQMNARKDLIYTGIKAVSQINFTICCLISLHTSQGLPMTKSILLGICGLIEILKGMHSVFTKQLPSILSSGMLISQHLTFQCIRSVSAIKKSIMQNRNYNRQQLDELTAFVIAERVLNGPCTIERRIIANIALSMVPTAKFADGGQQKLETLLNEIELFVDVKNVIDKRCSFPSFSWLRTIIPIYLGNAYITKQNPKKMTFIFKALEESCSSIHTEQSVAKYRNEISSYIDEQILKPIGHQVETNLRLNIHSHLQLDSMNPFNTATENTQALLSASDYCFMNDYVSITQSIENYLSLTFYNLTTVVLHDWKTYGEMRQLAKFKYNLQTVEDNLPTQTLEQGLDVLEIMRNIHIFVSKYLYNLNNQIFIEQSSNNKHLNTINIKHIANSIRTHGTGIMNTTVNFTYQFLKKKFFTFSQFMYDEHIKSRLMKDLRFFRETSTANDNMYSYKRADKFNKGIRNLGMTDNNQSYLDLFRVLISQIGNAMGYVRMIRSGGLHCCANATVFLQTLESSLSFKELSERDNLDESVKNSAENLDHVIDNMLTNFSQGTEYFKLLVDVFAPVFRNPKNIHLKNFYMIVPPLTINYVENMILCKDHMTKKNKAGAAFTDDGFGMGLAYILKLLDQDSELNSLHWFDSVWKHINDEFNVIQKENEKGSAQLQQTLALSEKKLTILRNEFQLLFFSFSSARIFFQ